MIENFFAGGPMILLAIEDVTQRVPLREKQPGSK
jgi:hypothetical protein